MNDLFTDPSASFFKFEVDYERPPAPITIWGRGFLGGKAVGLVYAAHHLDDPKSWSGVAHGGEVAIPATTVLTSEYFDRFREHNRITTLYAEVDYDELVRRYLAATFPAEDRARFRALLASMDYPLAIRSSSLLEDNIKYSFAGIYLTLFIPNRDDMERRLDSFERAVKRVFASTYNPDAHAYRDNHGLRGRQEKMAVLVQRLIGKPFGDLFYPTMAGVAFSRNYFPWSSRVRADDGLVRLVFGLGTRAVGRNYARVFSPAQPMLRPEGAIVDQIVRYSQEIYDALELSTGALVSRPVRTAVATNPELARVASVLEDHETLSEPSPFGLEPDQRPILTFRSILRENRYMPLVPLIQSVLGALEERFGLAVDVEFACNFDERRDEPSGIFYLLQCRPLGVRAKHSRVRLPRLDRRTVLFSGGRAMGNGERRGIKHLIYVPAKSWREVPAAQLARRIGQVAQRLAPDVFILAGPGRWGSNNPELGIPVTYGEIANARVLVEFAAGDTTPELSYGTHFFGDLFADDSYYLPVFPEMGDRVNEAWLDGRPSLSDDERVRLITLDEGFTATFDGHTREAAVYL